MGWTVIGGVLCPGLESLPRLRVAGTPRDIPAAVECPLMLPTDVCASWLTRILFSGGYVGPQSPVAATHGCMVHAIESMTDISDDGTVWRIKVLYGVARGTRLDPKDQLAARLPDSFILKLYDDTPTMTARGNNDSMMSRAPTPAHVPICYWSCLNTPHGAGVMPLVDPTTVSLLSWLADEEWCAFDPEIKRRYAREAKAVRRCTKQSLSQRALFRSASCWQLVAVGANLLDRCCVCTQRRDGERLQRKAAREAREAEALRREEAGEDSLGEEDEDEDDEEEVSLEDVCQALHPPSWLRFMSRLFARPVHNLHGL